MVLVGGEVAENEDRLEDVARVHVEGLGDAAQMVGGHLLFALQVVAEVPRVDTGVEREVGYRRVLFHHADTKVGVRIKRFRHTPIVSETNGVIQTVTNCVGGSSGPTP